MKYLSVLKAAIVIFFLCPVSEALSAGITVTPTSGLTTTELGWSDDFRVVLDTQPTDDVRIDLYCGDVTEGTVNPPSLTFTAGNWDIPQPVTITGVDDALNDGDVSFTIVTSPAISTDGDYNGMDPADVSVTNTNIDGVSVVILGPTGGLTTTESGGTATFRAVLSTTPSGDVFLSLSSSETTEGTVNPPSLTFTAGNWDIPQPVMIAGVDDAVDDGDVSFTIVTSSATSTDAGFDGFNPPDVSVTNTDDDIPGISVSPTSGLVTTESGQSDTFVMVLDIAPTADVTVTLSSSDTTEGTVNPASLTFTAGNWDIPQPVTITGVDDAVDDGDVSFIIVTSSATSADAGFDGIDPPDVAVTNTDDDTQAIPTLNEWGMSILSFLLVMSCIVIMRNKKRAF